MPNWDKSVNQDFHTNHMDKLIIIGPLRNSSSCMETEGSSVCSQEPATCARTLQIIYGIKKSFVIFVTYITVQPGYLEVTVLRRGVREVLVVAGRAPACWQVWRGMQYRRSQKEIYSYLIVLYTVGDLVSVMLSAEWQTIMHFALLYTIHYYTRFTVICMKS
jgi:hypothetical protein